MDLAHNGIGDFRDVIPRRGNEHIGHDARVIRNGGAGLDELRHDRQIDLEAGVGQADKEECPTVDPPQIASSPARAPTHERSVRMMREQYPLGRATLSQSSDRLACQIQRSGQRLTVTPPQRAEQQNGPTWLRSATAGRLASFAALLLCCTSRLRPHRSVGRKSPPRSCLRRNDKFLLENLPQQLHNADVRGGAREPRTCGCCRCNWMSCQNMSIASVERQEHRTGTAAIAGGSVGLSP
jgi:hypothetical protein